MKQEGPALLLVMETKISGKHVENLRITLGFLGCFGVDSDGLRGGLSCASTSLAAIAIK
jgi:hypothetical protein